MVLCTASKLPLLEKRQETTESVKLLFQSPELSSPRVLQTEAFL